MSEAQVQQQVGRAPVQEDNATVAAHYSSRKDVAIKDRKKSPIFALRNFNNWIKSVLIDQVPRRRDEGVLDLSCGKGGDLRKWTRRRIYNYTGTDIALGSLKDAQERYNDDMRLYNFPVRFIHCDATHDVLASVLEPQLRFDIVSCQFALHYSFGSEETARCWLRNVSERLSLGGHFCGTIPDADVIVKQCRVQNTLEYKNAVFSIKFDEVHRDHILPAASAREDGHGRDRDTDSDRVRGVYSKVPTFGMRYTFSLVSAVEDCPEYLVHWDSFQRLCWEYGLELRFETNFHNFYGRHHRERKYQQLLRKIRVVELGKMDDDQWEAARLYKVFMFEKVRASKHDPASRGDPRYRPQRRPLDDKDILSTGPASGQ